MLDLREVALAALLHCAGAVFGKNGEFDRVLRERGYSETVREAALRPESRLPEALVVRAAKTLAVSGEGLEGADPDAPLASVFDSIRLDGRPRPERRAYRPVEYGGDEVRSYLPLKNTDGGDREGDQEKARDALARKLGGVGRTPDANSVMNLLERYGSYLRSGVGGGDVSLFDHSRATAALAVCMAGHLNSMGEKPKPGDLERADVQRYLFVRGDISRVQKFIYTITSKGALRMLRSRSFFLELITEHAVAEILRHSGAPRTNVILAGGGGFQLLLPNTNESRDAVNHVKEELNDALVRDFGHDLYLALATSPCSASGLTGEGLSQTLGGLGEKLSGEKAGKFRASFPGLFSDQPEPELESCDVCARDDVEARSYETKGYSPAEKSDETIALCGTCHMLASASLKLARAKYLTDGWDFRIGYSGYGLSGQSREALYALDGVGDEACLEGAIPFPAAIYATRDEEDQIMDFGELSKRAAGIPRLAVLRMDVDNLGDVFRSGLPGNMRTFSRYAALSRAFTTFFKMVLPRICAGGYERSSRLFSKDPKRAVTVVYSGGDDLFIVGAWSDVLELAIDVRRAFGEFVGENPSVTLSAGISIHKPGEPLYLMAEAAGAAEEAAKSNEENGRSKDSAVLFYRGPDARRVSNGVPESLYWDEVEGVVGLLERINAFRGPDGKLPFPRGFTRLLLDVVDVYEQEGHLSLPRLAYALARMEESGRLREDRSWQELKCELLKIETIEKHLRPAATWLDLAEREGAHTAFRCSGLNEAVAEAISRAFEVGMEIEVGPSRVRILDVKLEAATYEDLYERFVPGDGVYERISLRFVSPTTFRVGKANMPLPLPRLLWRSWAARWNAFSKVQVGGFEEWAEEFIVPARFRLKSVAARAGGATLVGAVGECEYRVLRPDSIEARVAAMLAAYSGYCGSGQKTTMGLGVTELSKTWHGRST